MMSPYQSLGCSILDELWVPIMHTAVYDAVYIEWSTREKKELKVRSRVSVLAFPSHDLVPNHKFYCGGRVHCWGICVRKMC